MLEATDEDTIAYLEQQRKRYVRQKQALEQKLDRHVEKMRQAAEKEAKDKEGRVG